MFGRAAKLIVLAAVLSTFAAIAFGAYLMMTLPQIDRALSTTRPPSIVFLDRSGNKITGINDAYGQPIEVRKLPTHVWQAIVAVEDRRFFKHRGIDPRGLLRALWRNTLADKAVQGGSTITQQVAKNIFLTRDKTFARKIQELMIALWIEHKFTKEQILTLYLNRVSLVSGRYGIAAASEELFGKPAEELHLMESAMLAGMLKAPHRYSPSNDIELAVTRARIVLNLMLEQKLITHSEFEEAMTYRYRPPARTNSMRRYFVDYASSEAASLIGLPGDDIIVYTTMDTRAQAAAEGAVAAAMRDAAPRHRFSQTATVFLDAGGGIIAMIGGRDYVESQFNRASQMARQPASLFKTFVVLAALEAGIRPDEMFSDQPTCIANWCPQNFDGRYRGPVSMSGALEHSINTVMVQIALKVGFKNIVAAANKLGLIDRMSNDYSIILGTSEATPLDIAAAYSVIARGGIATRPHSITRIESGGTAIFERERTERRLVREDVAATLNNMLRQAVASGSAAGARITGLDIRGKTGTSQNFRDAWFAGYTDLVTGIVWIGNDDNAPMAPDTYGGGVPATIFRDIMSAF